jgi:RES domain
VVTRQWRADRRVGRARIDEGGRTIVDLEDLAMRRSLEESHAALLAAHGMRNLDISQLRSSQRVVTQTIALDLYGQGCAGIAYNSNLDGGACVALFEGRADVQLYGAAQQIDAGDPDLKSVCTAWGIAVE